MRPPWWGLTFPILAIACSGGSRPHGTLPADQETHSQLAEEDAYVPPYGKPDLQRALIAERGAEASQERIVGELEAKPERDAPTEDRLHVAAADLAVRRRFIQTLEVCEAHGRWCPPRLDDPPFAFDPDPDRPVAPPVDAPLKFDVDGWRKLASELHGRACACRTLSCVDAVGVAIDQLEGRTAPAVQGDEVAAASVTRARECLFRLRGREAHARAPRPLEE